MTIKRLLGTAPEQVSRNRDLGNLAFQNKEGPHFDNLIVDGTVGIGSTNATDILVVNNSNAYAIGLYRNLDYNSVGAMGTAVTFGGNVGSTRTASAQIMGVLNTATNGYITFNTLNTTMAERMRVNATELSLTNLQGIKFQATQSASSDANTLDDYEEGTWTPTLRGTATNPVYTASVAGGKYTKIGRIVHIDMLMVITGVTSQGSGNIFVSGLPFSSASTSNYAGVLTIGYNDIWDTDWTRVYTSGSDLYPMPVGPTQANCQYGGTSPSTSNLSTGYFAINGVYIAA